MLRHGLAQALAAADWNLEALVANGYATLARKPRWMRPLLRRVLATFPECPAPGDLEEFLFHDEVLRSALSKSPIYAPAIRHWILPKKTMASVTGPPATFPVPALATPVELAEWLSIAEPELSWFADLAGRNARTTDERLRHYSCRIVPKRSGGLRLLESPKPRLRAIQRQLNANLLAAIPVSPRAHGFVPGRSIHTFVTPHIGKRVVVRMDIADFFPSIASPRIRAIFKRVGYPEEVSARLAGLCTARTPDRGLEKLLDVAPDYRSKNFIGFQRWRGPHLPQGAPTSPALSNLVAFALDRRLSALAQTFDADYTRYADDLAFSGDAAFARHVHSFIPYAATCVMDEGFDVRFSKTRIMFSGKRQHLTGLVINAKANVPRRDYDRLRALLHSATHTGLEAQNRDGHPSFRAHLLGKIAYVGHSNPARGARLMKLFDQVQSS